MKIRRRKKNNLKKPILDLLLVNLLKNGYLKGESDINGKQTGLTALASYQIELLRVVAKNDPIDLDGSLAGLIIELLGHKTELKTGEVVGKDVLEEPIQDLKSILTTKSFVFFY
jgi:hypothetical protein